jgi:ABC-type dipeptide/oligopeptide/nickel transport system permease component
MSTWADGGGATAGARAPGAVLARYIGWRLAQGVLVVLGATVLSFLITNLSGNPGQVIGGSFLSSQQRQQIIDQLGYNRPMLPRLGSYLAGAVHGDFGTSYQTGEPALHIVVAALPNTILLIACAIAVAVLAAVPIAMTSVLHRASRADRTARVALMLAGALPDFWIAIILVLLLSVRLPWLPAIGFTSAKSLVIPVLALAIPLVPALVRLLRGAMLDVMGQEFVTVLRAKGLTDRFIVTHQAFKNALAPFVTLLAMQIGWLLGGTIIIEVIFAWPGIGSVINDAVQSRDVAVVQAAVVVVACGYVVLNLAADICVSLIDPRIRSGARS